MIEPEINIHIEQKLKIHPEEDWFRSIARKTLEAEGIMPPVEMGLVITDAYTVQRLNMTYRGEDKPTDVLAFHMSSHVEQKHESCFITPPDGVHHLGEVVISYPQAIQQAQERGHSPEKELALLTVHGVLHLLGYDHEQTKERQSMRAREKAILRELDSVESEK